MGGHATVILGPTLVVLRADLRRRWRAWLLLGVITGVSIGAVGAAIVGARRTASAFDRFTSSSQAADVIAIVTSREAGEALAGVDGVAEVAHVGVLGPLFLILDGRLTPVPTDVTVLVADDRYGVDIERTHLGEGRRPAAGAVEAQVNRAFVDQVGLDVGDHVEVVVFPDDISVRFRRFEDLATAFATDRTLGRSSSVEIVGRGLRAGDVVRDTSSQPAYLVLDRQAAAAILGGTLPDVERAFDGGHAVAIRLDHSADVDAVLTQVRQTADDVTELPDIRAEVADAVRPYVVALEVFAVLAGLAVVAVVGSAVIRQAVAQSSGDPILASLGANRHLLRVIAAARTATVAAVATLIAASVTIGASPLFPLGPVADVEPHPGVLVDLAVLIPSSLIVLTAVVTVGVIASSRHRHDRASVASPVGLSTDLTRALPLTPGVGVRFAFPPRGGSRVLMRATIVAVAVALFGGCAVAVFAGSLDDLVDHPRRHGWGWDLAVTCNQGYCDLPLDVMSGTLRATSGVAGWSFLSFSTLELDGRLVPVLGAGFGRGDLQPLSVSDGRPPATPDEVALGAATMRSLHVAIGDEVNVGSGTRRLRVVGRAVFSGLGPADASRPSLGTGAALTAQGLLDLSENRTLPDAVVVAVQGGPHTVASALRDQLSGHTVLEIQQPAGLAAWSSLRRLPVLLGLLLGLLALASLTHGLAMSNQLHRRDLAVLNSLGMRTRQLTSVVCWQAAAIVGASLVIGVPLGLIAGRAAWRILVERVGVTSAAGLAPGPILIATAAAVAAVAALTIVVARSAGRHNHAAELRGE